MTLHRSPARPPPPSHRHHLPHLLPSFIKNFPRMSTSCLHSPPQLPPEIVDFEHALFRDLSSLKPPPDTPLLCLEWLARGLDLALAKHHTAVLLIPPFQGSPSLYDEKWVSDYFDQTTRFLDACNLLFAEISDLEQGHLLIRYAVNILGDPNMGLNEHKVSRARDSLRQWRDTACSFEKNCSENSRSGKCRALLREMCKGLVVPKERDSRKGFLFALYGANATAVFVFTVLMIATSRDGEVLSFSLPLPTHLSWTAPIFDMMELAREEANLCISAGSTFLLRDLHDLNISVTDLLNVLDSIMMEREYTLTKHQSNRLTKDIEALSQLVNVLAARLDSVGRKQNEVFREVVASRTALLDQLGNFRVSNEV